MTHVVYFSNYSGNTKRFVEKLDVPNSQIPIRWSDEEPLTVEEKFVLFVPTYGGGSSSATVPKQVKKFLNVKHNRDRILGVVGFGNTNFGNHYCKAAYIVAEKLGVPVLDKVEIFGTPEDVERVKTKLEEM